MSSTLRFRKLSIKALPAFVLWAMALAPLGLQAYERVAETVVLVRPNVADWRAETGQPVDFTVEVLRDRQPVADVMLSWTVGEESARPEPQNGTLGRDGLTISGGTLEQPGFLRCQVTATLDGESHTAMATVAFSPEEIQPSQINPDDFEAFWQEGKDALSKIPMKPTMVLLPERCTDKVNVYHVSFLTWTTGWGPSRIYGIYAEPKEPGKYPAVLRVPGAGVRPYYGEIGLAEEGFITLQIGIHGIPVTLEGPVYNELRQGALNYYPYFNLDNREIYYFRRVYLGCLRANDFLTSRDTWNGQDLIVTGGSQGGQLTIVTAALDPRVTALAAAYPAYSDVTGYLEGRAGGWPHMFRPQQDGSPNTQLTPEKLKTTQYYDTVNFARRLEVPALLTFGYNDSTCPPTSMYAAYNVIDPPKKLVLALETGHFLIPSQEKAIREWIRQHAGY